MKKNSVEKYISSYRKETSLFLYSFYCAIDFLIFIFKFILSGFFPIIISIIAILILNILNIDPGYNAALSWGLFGAAGAMFSIGFSVVIALYGSNKKYFKQNILVLFGNYKLFGVVDVFVLIGITIFSVVFSLVCTIKEDKFCNLLSFSAITYVVISIVLIVMLVSKNDENKYVHYLKNTGVLKKKRRSIKMNQSIAFGIAHPKAKKFGQKLAFFQINPSLIHETKITTYFKNPYDYKDSNLYTNIELVSFYLIHCPEYISTDTDLIRIKLLIDSINNTVIDFLVREKQFEILENFLESLALFAVKVLLNKRVLTAWTFNVNEIDKVNMSQKDKLNLLSSTNSKIQLSSSLIMKALFCFEKIENLEPEDDVKVVAIKNKYKNVLESLKEYRKKFEQE